LKLNFQALSKQLGSQLVLRGIDAEFSPLQCLALIGPSGSGKSTLLRLLAGLDTPDTGAILIDDRPLPTRERALRKHRARLGIVFQAYNLFPHLSALENITLPLERVHRFRKSAAEQIALETLERFQLAAHAHKKPAALSGGQQQRVAVARAVACKPDLLLLDEPTSALDPEMTSEVLDLLLQLRSEGRPMVIVTHSMGFARKAADAVAFLADGQILEHGPAEALFSAPKTQALRDFLDKVLRY
jgi:polar amino acid transport system ATP-binding protein